LNNGTGTSLLVDFGIHTKRVNQSLATNRFNDIYKDIKHDDLDFLLSHYHEDHFNGAVFINDNYSYMFKDVYIPDIWSIDGTIAAVQLQLLYDMLSIYELDSSNTIFDFLKAICGSNIHFVQRGSPIQDKYIALWPSTDYVSQKAKSVLTDALEKANFNEEQAEALRTLANDFSNTVRSYAGINNNNHEAFVSQMNGYDDRLRSLKNQMIDDDVAKKLQVKLHNYGNDISIVFQNKKDMPECNVLLTGDFGKLSTNWNKIETNFDNSVDCIMHDHYHQIKVGHHGTRPYYHSFIPRIDDQSVLLIPNGDNKCKWNICSDYSLNAFSTGAKIVCSTDWSCEAKINNKTPNCTLCPCQSSRRIDRNRNGIRSLLRDRDDRIVNG